VLAPIIAIASEAERRANRNVMRRINFAFYGASPVELSLEPPCEETFCGRAGAAFGSEGTETPCGSAAGADWLVT
jgi:hypothetical protein